MPYRFAASFTGGRGVFCGGSNSSAKTDEMQYITIATPADASDFGDLTTAVLAMGACSNGTRGLWGCGLAATITDVIAYITIDTLGDALDFGDATQVRYGVAGLGGNGRGLFNGGYDDAPIGTVATIDFVTIDTTGNASDFGDLTSPAYSPAGASDNVNRGIVAGGAR